MSAAACAASGKAWISLKWLNLQGSGICHITAYCWRLKNTSGQDGAVSHGDQGRWGVVVFLGEGIFLKLLKPAGHCHG